MKTAKYISARQFDVADIPMPELGEGETAIKVEYCAICGSDIHSFNDGTNTDVLGHEFVGTVVRVGSNTLQMRRLAAEW